MGTAKLMTPLFYDGNYNVEKKRMRAVLEREVSNGAVSYRLWRSDGKPDLGSRQDLCAKLFAGSG